MRTSPESILVAALRAQFDRYVDLAEIAAARHAQQGTVLSELCHAKAQGALEAASSMLREALRAHVDAA